MSSLPQVATALRRTLIEAAEAAATASGFTQRRSKLTAPVFVQTLVLGWLGTPDAGTSALTRTAAALGRPVSSQALDQRFGPAAAALLEAVLAAAVREVVRAEAVGIALLNRFTGGSLLDSTTVTLPDQLAAVWAGCQGRTEQGTQAAVKLTVHLDLCSGALTGPLLSAGRTQDRGTPLQHAPVPRGGLRVSDLGFWSLAVFQAIAAAGAFWLSRLNLQVVVADAAGQRRDLARWLQRQRGATLEVPVQLGATPHLPARLLAARLPPAVAAARRRQRRAAAKREGKTPSRTALALAGWTLLVTNVPAAALSVAEALVLARARWQIELLFKLWKSHGQVATSGSAQPWRILCEVEAKLIAMVIQHWVLLVGCWEHADRSLVQAAAAVRAQAMGLALARGHPSRLRAVLRAMQAVLRHTGKLQRRRPRPSTAQLLTTPALGAWP